jgi:predicted permease
MDAVWRDIRYTARLWRKSPAFFAVVVLTLAVGIAANTVVFAVINTLFLNPLPLGKPDELVTVRTTGASSRTADALPISYLNLQDLRTRQQVFARVAGHSSPLVLTLLNGDTPQRLFGELVSGNYFDTLGLRPVRGRFFLPAEDASPGAAPVLVMAHAAWQRRFGGADDIVGRTLRINGVIFTVIGVAPDGFKGVNAVFGPDVWMPVTMAEAVLPASMKDWLTNRSAASLRGVARLSPGVSIAAAGANVATVAGSLAQDYPDANRGRSVAVDPLTRAGLVAPGRLSATTMSLVLLSIPGLVLLIACANVANLLMARAEGRRREVAVRLAMGSDRPRLLRQLLTESLMLAGLAGVAGIALAYGGLRALWSLRPPDVAANLIDLDLDVGVLLFAALVSAATSLLFGLVPAWRSTRTDVAQALNDEGRSVGHSQRGLTLGKVLMSSQAALSLVALVTAGLLLRSVQHAYRVDPGFEPRRMGIAMMSPGQAGYTRVRAEQFFADVRARVSATPGVVSAGWGTQLPLFARASRAIVIEGRDASDRAQDIISIVNSVDEGYFPTTGIRTTRGRAFTEGDRDGTLPVAIVNEVLAARAWPGLDPIGRRLRLAGDGTLREVVGVAKTVTYETIGEAPQACLYLPLRQQFSDAAVFYVRTEGEPTAALAEVQRIVRSMDSHIDVGDVRTIETVIGQSLFGATIGVGLLGLFGLVALGLASLGLYGAVAHSVRLRRREIGVRMALGAGRRAVLGLVLRQGLMPVAAGVVIGGLLAAAVGRLMTGVLFGVPPIDPIAMGAAAGLLSLVAVAACYLPARAASRVDPMIALRDQ